MKAWTANKNFPGIEQALESSMNLEKLVGAEKAGRTIVTPKDETDTEGWKAIGAKLGVPANAADYKLPVPEGDKGEFATLASTWMQNANIPPVMARELTKQWNAHVAEIETKAKAEAEQAVAKLTTEWGPKAAENTELARRGFREFASKFGIDKDPTAVEDALGSANFLRFFQGLGSLNAESAFAGGTANASTTSGNPAPTEAMAKIHAFQDARMKGEINDYQWNREIMPQITALEKIVTGGR